MKYVMNCIDFGPKFKFDAENQKDADIKARKYCHYHSKPDQFTAEPYDNNKGYGFTLQLHNEYID